MKPELHQLKFEEYQSLFKSGMLWEIYPDATGVYYQDVQIKQQEEYNKTDADSNPTLTLLEEIQNDFDLMYSVYYKGSDQEHSGLCYDGRRPALFNTRREAEEHLEYLADGYNNELMKKYYAIVVAVILK